MKNREQHVRSLLFQALHVSSNDSVKGRIREAIQAVDKEAKKETKKKQSNLQEKWWGNVQAGTARLAAANFAPQGHAKTLKELNALIKVEELKIDELERQVDATNNVLLQE